MSNRLIVAVLATEVPLRGHTSSYPAEFVPRVAGREKRMLGAVFGLSNFGVNLTRLAPQAQSSLRHAHTKQDEFVYILEGHPTLYTEAGAQRLSPGMCAGFKAGSGDAHHLINESAADVVYLEIGDRTAGDGASYPDDDLAAAMVEGGWRFTHKDGTPYGAAVP
ncbi:MAG: cupin [Myxococcaceae bacterium]|nr:cupin [Myxococcaceae bacterium]